jgi:hypothetical protein
MLNFVEKIDKNYITYNWRRLFLGVELEEVLETFLS